MLRFFFNLIQTSVTTMLQLRIAGRRSGADVAGGGLQQQQEPSCATHALCCDLAEFVPTPPFEARLPASGHCKRAAAAPLAAVSPRETQNTTAKTHQVSPSEQRFSEPPSRRVSSQLPDPPACPPARRIMPGDPHLSTLQDLEIAVDAAIDMSVPRARCDSCC